MSAQLTSIEHIIFELTKQVNMLLKAEYGVCYFQIAPTKHKAFNIVHESYEEQTHFAIDNKTIDEILGGKNYPVVYSGRIPLAANLDKSRAYSPGHVSLLLYIPIIHNDRMIALLEIANPHNNEFLQQKKPLRAFHNIIQNGFIARLQSRTSDERSQAEHDLIHDVSEIVGSSPVMLELKSTISRIAATDGTVIIKGETGTGKNIIAHSIHNLSNRRDMPFVKVNCSAIPENLLESELFGHEKGAFTGALQRRIGRFELAHLGTIFLDEIGEISLDIQVKLLNVLQEQEFERLGSTQTIKVDTRIIAATNKDIEAAILNGEFRQDLYYRLYVLPITAPPLRERIDDLELLTPHFIKKLNHKLNLHYKGISDGAHFLLKQYEWPGNIRELENVIERAMFIGNGSSIQPKDLPHEIIDTIDSVRSKKKMFALREGQKSLWDVEKGIIERALTESKWNQSKTARVLCITRNHLRYRIKKYGIKKPESSSVNSGDKA